MKQPNSIRTLENILRRAIKETSNDKQTGSVLTSAMSLKAEPENLMGFLDILSGTTKDIAKLKDVEDLRVFQTNNHPLN